MSDEPFFNYKATIIVTKEMWEACTSGEAAGPFGSAAESLLEQRPDKPSPIAALQSIALRRCENYTGGWTCHTAGGRVWDAEHGAEQVCYPCYAAQVLEGMECSG